MYISYVTWYYDVSLVAVYLVAKFVDDISFLLLYIDEIFFKYTCIYDQLYWKKQKQKTKTTVNFT